MLTEVIKKGANRFVMVKNGGNDGIKQENQQITGDGINTYSNIPFYIKRTNRPISFDSVLSSINFDCACPPSMSENPRNSWNNPYNHDAYLIRIKAPSGW